MYTAILQKIPVVLVALIFLAALAILYFRSKNVNRTEFLQIFKNARFLGAGILAFAMLFTALFGVFNHLDLRQSVHAVISLNYSEASQAQNSNGTRYNMAEILSDEVIAKAIKKGAFENVTVKQLKNCLSVYPYVQGDATNESKYHISTEFAVEYHASKHTAHLDAENVILMITSSYKDYYTQKYTDSFSLDATTPDFSTMEYMDVVSYLDKEATAVINYLYGMNAKNSSFVTESGNTFSSIAGKVYQFRETQINQNLRSLILQNGIGKNSAGYVERLLFRNKTTDFDRQKNQISFELCNRAIDMYSEEMTRIVLVPTWDQTGKYYMGRTKVGVDEISVWATEFSDYVASNEKTIMDNNLIIEKMNASTPDEADYGAANSLIESIYKAIKEYEKEAIKAGREYSNYKMNQCVAVSIYGVSLMGELKSLILFAAFAYLTLVLYDISKKLPKKA